MFLIDVRLGLTAWIAAGNFIYIGASDLVPEVDKHRSARSSLVHFAAFAAGLALLWAMQRGLAP